MIDARPRTLPRRFESCLESGCSPQRPCWRCVIDREKANYAVAEWRAIQHAKQRRAFRVIGFWLSVATCAAALLWLTYWGAWVPFVRLVLRSVVVDLSGGRE